MFRLSHIAKSFGSTRAVDDVSLEFRRGEILAVVGENGAGKTTLMRIAAGELAADRGTIELEGRSELVHQHFMLVPALTIAENLALGRRERFRIASRRSVEREAKALIAESGIELGGVSRRVADLSVGEKSKLELIKAIVKRPSTLVLDEPTAVLTPFETDELFRVMRRLAREGTAVVFISHKLPEVIAVAERIVVMRQGRIVLETRTEQTSADRLAEVMVKSGGLPSMVTARREPHEGDRKPHEGDREPHEGDRKPLQKGSANRVLLFEGLEVAASEIVAVVGVAGNGQTELAAALRERLPQAAHIPEDRTRDGIIAPMTIAENLALRARRWRRRSAIRHAERMIALYSIRASGPLQRAGDLSGGNQQKVILARELNRSSDESVTSFPAIIVAAEPTRGLDIEATRFVHAQLRSAATAGAAILLITSDLDEAFALADGMHVIYRRRLSERMTPADAVTRVPKLMAGVA